MEIYKNLGRNSGVLRYEIKEDSIKVEFKDRALYLYNYKSSGQKNIEHMKLLAIAGRGLNTFIISVVRKHFAVKLR